MSLETGSYIKNLVATNPEGTDPKSQGDDHLRLLKQVLKTQFAGFTDGIGITKTESQINSMLTAGAFGLGGTAIQILEADLISDTLPTGFYYIVNGSGGNLPGGIGALYIYRIDLSAPGYWCNVAVSADLTNASVFFTQTKYNGAVQPWRRFWNNLDTPKQVTALDTTDSAILNPGSFGLGKPMAAAANADLNWGPYAKTLYCARWGGNSWVNCPTGENASIAMVEWKCYNPDWGEQTFISISTKQRFVRYWYNAASWTQWFKEATEDSSYKAANGWQTINGVMRQWGTVAAMSQGTQVSFPFITAFASGQCWGVQANCSAFYSGNFYIVNVTAYTHLQFTLGYMANTASPSGPIWWEAVGLAP